MVIYDLECVLGHRFEGWFPSSQSFESQRDEGKIQCSHCGVYEVRKIPSGCNIATKSPAPKNLPPHNLNTESIAEAVLSFDAHTVLKSMHHWIDQNCEFVGKKFASEAIDMHLGKKPHKAIYGTIEEGDQERMDSAGVPFVTVPKLPERLKN